VNRPRLLRWLVASGVLVAAIAHAWYWYAPRERTGIPAREGLARQLLADPTWDWVLWVPYPHQNLARLEDEAGDPQQVVAALAAWTGAEAPRWPAFGPFSAPPASELVVAVDRVHGCTLVEADVFPLVALAARAAGTLAGNPWLGGGEVELDRRPASVGWQGHRWRVSSCLRGPAKSLDLPPEMAGPVLSALRLREPSGPLPAGIFRLIRGPEGLEADLGEPPAAGPRVDPAAAAGTGPLPVAWLVATERGPVAGPEAFLLFEGAGPAANLPPAARLRRGASNALRLPGEALARLAGWGLLSEARAGFELRALSPEALAGARRFADWLAAQDPGADARGPVPALLAEADPARTARLAEHYARELDQVPILGLREGEKLHGLARLLAPWRDCGRVALAVYRRPAAVRLRLCVGESTAAPFDGSDGIP
jgi:hypothetical protein